MRFKLGSSHTAVGQLDVLTTGCPSYHTGLCSNQNTGHAVAYNNNNNVTCCFSHNCCTTFLSCVETSRSKNVTSLVPVVPQQLQEGGNQYKNNDVQHTDLTVSSKHECITRLDNDVKILQRVRAIVDCVDDNCT